MKKYILFLFGLLLVFTGCREEELDMTLTQKTLFENAVFDAFELKNAWNVTIIQDDQISGLELEYSSYLEEYLDVTLDGSTLKIGLNKQFHIPYNTVMNAVVHVKDLRELNAKSATEVTLDGAFTGTHLKLDLNGASVFRNGSFTGNADITLDGASQIADFVVNSGLCELEFDGASSFKGDLNADSLIVVMDGASRMVTYGGQVQQAWFDLESASIVNMTFTPIDKAFVELEGAAEAYLHVNVLLSGTLRAASTLGYEGNPTVDLDSDVSSSFGPL